MRKNCESRSWRIQSARENKRFSMKRKRLCGIALIICAASGALVWCLSHNGIRKGFAASGYNYYKYGFIDRNRNGLVYDRDTWWYVRNGKVDTEYVGLVEYNSELWRVKEGTVDFSYEGFEWSKTGWWYVEGGKVQRDVTGLRYGVIATDVTGAFYPGSLPGVTGLYSIGEEETAGWWYVENGKVVSEDTIIKENSCWWYIRKGRVWFSYCGIAENENGKFYIENGHVLFSKNGVFRQSGGTYLLTSGKVTDEIHRDSTRFIAHRGLRSEAPENTLKAFELAGEAGFWGCETDIRLTEDGRFVLLHDKSFLRLCGTDVLPGDLTAEEISRLTIVNGAGLEEYSGDTSATSIAFLEDYLAICLQYNMVPVMDIKLDSEDDAWEGYTQIQMLYDTVKSVLGEHEAVFIATDLTMLRQMRLVLDNAGDTAVSLQLVIRDQDEISIEEYQSWGISPDIKYASLNENTIAYFKENNLAVNVWTVDAPDKIAFLLRQGVEYITTNKRFW